MSLYNYQLHPLGDSAVIIELGQAIDPEIHRQVRALVHHLEREPFPGLVEYVPAFASVTLFYDPVSLAASAAEPPGQPLTPYQKIGRMIEGILEKIKVAAHEPPRIMEIPVCYGGHYGPDLDFVAEYNKLTPEEVITIHSGGDYLVYMIGFAPGFPYLGGMPEKIAAPRKDSPRLAVPAGSVGIGGCQTGIYPLVTPGGWQLIGRTPLNLFRPRDKEPSLLRAGDRVRFVPISTEEYEAIREGAWTGDSQAMRVSISSGEVKAGQEGGT